MLQLSASQNKLQYKGKSIQYVYMRMYVSRYKVDIGYTEVPYVSVHNIYPST